MRPHWVIVVNISAIGSISCSRASPCLCIMSSSVRVLLGSCCFAFWFFAFCSHVLHGVGLYVALATLARGVCFRGFWFLWGFFFALVFRFTYYWRWDFTNYCCFGMYFRDRLYSSSFVVAYWVCSRLYYIATFFLVYSVCVFRIIAAVVMLVIFI